MPQLVGLFPGVFEFAMFLFVSITGYAVLLALALQLVRRQGIRLVRVASA